MYLCIVLWFSNHQNKSNNVDNNEFTPECCVGNSVAGAVDVSFDIVGVLVVSVVVFPAVVVVVVVVAVVCVYQFPVVNAVVVVVVFDWVVGKLSTSNEVYKI